MKRADKEVGSYVQTDIIKFYTENFLILQK